MKIFKTISLSSALALGFVIGSGIASAADSEYMKVNVPFSFVVSGKVLPAGTYFVQENSSGVVMFQGSGNAAVAMTVPVSPVKVGSIPSLRFTAANGREYLVSLDDNTVTRAVSSRSLETRTLTLSH